MIRYHCNRPIAVELGSNIQSGESKGAFVLETCIDPTNRGNAFLLIRNELPLCMLSSGSKESNLVKEEPIPPHYINTAQVTIGRLIFNLEDEEG